MAARRTRGEAEIEAKLQTLDPNSKRYHVLAAARDFKAAWVALGEELTQVREKGSFRDWGYPNFESYCRRELRIKKDTANKLTRSFSFLRDHEPSALEQREQRELPPLDVVDLLSRARERSKVSEPQLKDIQQEVFEPEKGPPTKNQVLKRFREIDPDAFRSAPRPASQGGGEGDLRKALLLAERLYSLVETLDGLSPEAVNGSRVVAAELKELFQQGQQTQKSA